MNDNDTDLWRYRARLIEIIDGDTQDFDVDLGFNITREMRVRLLGVDTAEIYGTKKESEEYQKGMEQKKYVAKWCDGVVTATDADEWPFHLRTYKDSTGKYGRYLADIEAAHVDSVELPDGQTAPPSLVDALLQEWPEAEYDG